MAEDEEMSVISEATLVPDRGESPSEETKPTEAMKEAPPISPADGPPAVSLKMWPPSERSRKAVIEQLITTLSAPSILSKRYGVIPPAEATATARRIEEDAFAASVAAAAATTAADGTRTGSVDEEVTLLHMYSREISRRAIGASKERGSTSLS